MACIRQRKDGWRAEVQRHGHRVSSTHKTKREAQAWALRKEAELDGIAKGAGRTFAALAKAYLQHVTPTKRSQRWEANAIARLRAQIGDATPLALIDSARIGLWRDERLRTVSGSTVQREANLLRNMLKVDVLTLARISRHRDLSIPTNTYYRESAEQIAATRAATRAASRWRESSSSRSLAFSVDD